MAIDKGRVVVGKGKIRKCQKKGSSGKGSGDGGSSGGGGWEWW